MGMVVPSCRLPLPLKSRSHTNMILTYCGKGPCSSSSEVWSRSLERLGNGLLETRSRVRYSSHMVRSPTHNSRGKPSDKILSDSLATGTFWIVQGTSNMPFYAVGTNYSPTGNTLEGIQTPEYNATVGLYYVVLALLTFIYLICSIRTNVCLFLALFLLVITFALTAATFFQVALGNAENAARLQLVLLSLESDSKTINKPVLTMERDRLLVLSTLPFAYQFGTYSLCKYSTQSIFLLRFQLEI